jgi:ceramide glucosyltransferase
VTLLALIVAVAAAYQVLALLAALLHLRTESPETRTLRPVSILKPVKGLDPHFYEAIRSHAVQDYPEYEILFGVADPEDPAVPEIRRLAKEFPDRQIRLVQSSRKAPNGKVGVLADLAAQARYGVFLVNDSDIRVPSGYLRQVVAALEDPGVGLVTCLYGAVADSWPGRWEAIGIASEFARDLLVARLLGVAEFGLGSTLLFRSGQLRQIGGFEALAQYLADDYQLGRAIHSLGLKVEIPRVVVETHLPGRTWRDVWQHQLRWARTIRVSRTAGYAGLPVTQASFWSLVAILSGAWWMGLLLLGVRVLAGVAVGVGILRSRDVARYFYLIPLRDLWGFAVWLCGLFGNTVTWRGARLRLTRDGRIAQVAQAPSPTAAAESELPAFRQTR